MLNRTGIFALVALTFLTGCKTTETNCEGGLSAGCAAQIKVEVWNAAGALQSVRTTQLAPKELPSKVELFSHDHTGKLNLEREGLSAEDLKLTPSTLKARVSGTQLEPQPVTLELGKPVKVQMGSQSYSITLALHQSDSE